MRNVKYNKVFDGYICSEDYIYCSPRFNKEITVHKGFYSDGATKAIDIDTDAFWIHDVLCRYAEFDDHTPCTNWQASMILSDILRSEGFWFRSITWFIATFLVGGGGCRQKMI